MKNCSDCTQGKDLPDVFARCPYCGSENLRTEGKTEFWKQHDPETGESRGFQFLQASLNLARAHRKNRGGETA